MMMSKKKQLKRIEERLEKIESNLNWLIRHQLKKDEPPTIPPYVPSSFSTEVRCQKCNMIFSGTTSYHCSNSDCPIFYSAGFSGKINDDN